MGGVTLAAVSSIQSTETVCDTSTKGGEGTASAVQVPRCQGQRQTQGTERNVN